MSTCKSVERDERTLAVENASCRWALNFTIFALLIDATCRSWFLDEAAWDLLALAVVPGIISSVYRARHKTLHGWSAVLLVCLAVVTAAFIAAMYQFHLLH